MLRMNPSVVACCFLLMASPSGCKRKTDSPPAATGGSASGAQRAACGSVPVEAGFVEIPASDPAIRYVGRFDFSDPGAPRLAYPAVTVETRFEGDALDLRIREGAPGGPTGTAYYSVSVDGGPPVTLETCAGQEVYPLARGLAAGSHGVSISKRTEAQVGSAAFLGLRVRPRTRLSPPAAPSRRLEFVGDSITCGYGNELSTTDPDRFKFTSANENALLAYGAVTARALGADYVAVAVSGRGMVRNYAGGPGLTAPDFYELAEPRAGAVPWDFSRYSPDVVVVNLGTNDFSIGLGPAEVGAMREKYRRAYAELLLRMRSRHPHAILIAAIGPMMSDSFPPGYQALTSVRADVQGVVKARVEAGDQNLFYFEFPTQSAPYGEDWHPTVATHQRMAERLATFIREKKGW